VIVGTEKRIKAVAATSPRLVAEDSIHPRYRLHQTVGMLHFQSALWSKASGATPFSTGGSIFQKLIDALNVAPNRAISQETRWDV
jgi:hypothetical protein